MTKDQSPKPLDLFLSYSKVALGTAVSIFGLVSFLYLNSAEFFKELFSSLIVGEIATFCCFWGAAVLEYAEFWWRIKRSLPLHNPTASSSVLKGCPFLFPGIYFGSKTLQAIGPTFGIHSQDLRWEEYQQGIITGLLCMAFFGIFYLRRERVAAELDAAIAKKEQEALALKAKIATLTSQMNPHLLFNSLNAIASLVHSEADKAETMILDLSDLYRRVLEASKKETHALANELEIAKAYLALEKVRFNERLSQRIYVAPEIRAESIPIPVLTLQPLLENAVKHGIFPKITGGTVELLVEKIPHGIKIRIKDDGVGFGNSPEKGTSTALKNCQERLKLFFGERVSFSILPVKPNGTEVLIVLEDL